MTSLKKFFLSRPSLTATGFARECNISTETLYKAKRGEKVSQQTKDNIRQIAAQYGCINLEL